jgi:hypothetical protein
VVQSLEFDHDRLHDSHRHTVVTVVRGESSRLRQSYPGRWPYAGRA